MLVSFVLACWLAVASADVSHIAPHIAEEPSTEPPPPKPYAFSYTAGRYPGHADRHHAEVSDGSGVVRGTFSYVDPRQKVRKVDYVADKQGFHPVLSEQPPAHPADTAAVARARDRHFQLYNKIAEDHAQHPYADEVSAPRQSAAVASAAARHAELFRVIAEQHARIAAERDELQREEDDQLQREEDGQLHLQELPH